MRVEFGNTAVLESGELVERDGPSVTYANLHDYGFDASLTVEAAKEHLYDAVLTRNGITSLPGQEALMALIHPAGIVSTHSQEKPSWVWSDDPELADWLGEYYGCPVGVPEGVEDTHHTLAGPPGVVPGANLNMSMQVTSNGRDIVARALGGGWASTTETGNSGVSTVAPTGTGYTLQTGTAAPGSTTYWTGQRIVAGSTSVGAVWANIISNTNASPPVLTVDRWYSAGSPGGAAATTPLAGPYAIIDGSAPAWFVGISTGSGAPGSAPNSNTSLPSEYTTAGGGLVRQIAPFAHTAGANTWTLTPVYTVNSTDVSSGGLPLTFASYGVFNSMVVSDTTGTMLYYNTMSSTATLAALSDTLTLTVTVTTT